MNANRRNIVTILAAAFAVLVMAACSSGKNRSAGYERLLSNDSIPDVIKDIVKSVYEDDSIGFAKFIAYPLQRPYPLKDIRNEDEMKAYYNIIMDDSLKNVILNASPEDWEEFGWRGYGLKDGTYLWVNESLYDIGYVSEKEKAMIDSLSRVEMNSLPLTMREGWQPVLTLNSEENGKIYRIDRHSSTEGTNPIYRLTVFDAPKEGSMPLNAPVLTLEGDMQTDGSAAVVSYIFRDSNGKEYVIYPDDPSSGNPVITEPDGSENELRKAYWYELIK